MKNTTKTSRRSFLKQSSLLVPASLLLSHLSTFASNEPEPDMYAKGDAATKAICTLGAMAYICESDPKSPTKYTRVCQGLRGAIECGPCVGGLGDPGVDEEGKPIVVFGPCSVKDPIEPEEPKNPG